MRYGYINVAQHIEFAEKSGEFDKYQCDLIFCEEEYSSSIRSAWRKLIDCLNENDEIFVLSFGNAFCDLNSFFYFIRYTVLKKVRLVSIHDEIDTKGELFKKLTDTGEIISHCFSVLGLLPLRIGKNRVSERKSSATPEHKQLFKQKKNECAMKAVNMYAAGYTVDEIKDTLGYKTRKSIYEILHRQKLKLRQPRQYKNIPEFLKSRYLVKKLQRLGYKADQIKRILTSQNTETEGTELIQDLNTTNEG